MVLSLFSLQGRSVSQTQDIFAICHQAEAGAQGCFVILGLLFAYHGIFDCCREAAKLRTIHTLVRLFVFFRSSSFYSSSVCNAFRTRWSHVVCRILDATVGVIRPEVTSPRVVSPRAYLLLVYRRYHETRLAEEIKELLMSWREYFDASHAIFVYAPGVRWNHTYRASRKSAVYSWVRVASQSKANLPGRTGRRRARQVDADSCKPT